MLSKKSIVLKTLLDELQSEKLVSGEFIPSRNQLMRRFHCSRTVIEKAIAELTSCGYLTGKQGKGTLIRRPPEKTPFKIRKMNVISPYDAKSFRSPESCLLLNSEALNMPVENFSLDRSEAESEVLSQMDSMSVFINPGYEQLPLMNFLKSRRIPLLIINREFDGFDRIYTDNAAGFTEGLTLLDRTSDSPVGVLSRQPATAYPYQALRLLAFYRVCTEKSIAISGENTLLAPFEKPEQDIAAAEKLFRHLPAKICVMNSDLLLPLLKFTAANGLFPGKDFHLLAFEYSPGAAGMPGIFMIRQRYDIFYLELIRFMELRSKMDFSPFVSVIPPEVTIPDMNR